MRLGNGCARTGVVADFDNALGNGYIGIFLCFRAPTWNALAWF
jgi:hypothetical protein